MLLDALGRRWALRILWELREGPRTFRALREACDGVSPAVLSERLAELRALGLVALADAGYHLTDDGTGLGEKLVALDVWATRWAARAKGGRGE